MDKVKNTKKCKKNVDKQGYFRYLEKGGYLTLLFTIRKGVNS